MATQFANAQLRMEAGGNVGTFGRNIIGYNLDSRNLSSAAGFDVNLSYNIKLLSDNSGTGLFIAPGAVSSNATTLDST